jgi:hypothetical protein
VPDKLIDLPLRLTKDKIGEERKKGNDRKGTEARR